ncbi:MAG: GGDEF domain-containing protein [Solirubrobacterales bacterium]
MKAWPESGIASVRRLPNPIDDSVKIAALRELELIESGTPEALDRLSQLAARLLGVPVALVTLVNDESQILLGQVGIEGEAAESRRMSLGHSFCRHAIARRAPLVIADARLDPLVRDNPAVDDFGCVAYAGIPLVLRNGDAIGAFCAIDHRPRAWSDPDLAILGDLAVAATEILDGRAALVHHDLHDRLTGLPNRELLVAACDDFLCGLGRGENVAVLCAGIDHFNMVNQAFGAEKADRILRAVAERMVNAVRETDVFGRLRGDVFTIVAPGIEDEAEALKLAARIHRVLSDSPLQIEGEPLSLGVTLGIGLGGAGATGSDLISDAANAMREAKRSQGRVRVAERGHSEDAAAQLRMREALHLACDRSEIEAVFQPIVSLETQRIAGFEALARWKSDALGAVSPAEFIPLAELTSDIVAIGELMIVRAAEFAAEARLAFGEEVRITLNTSPVQLDRPGFAATVREAFEAHGLTGRSVGIEITEGTLLETGMLEQSNLGLLREFGARVLLDDFGTGYSSFGYLRDFQIDTVKIDRSFVDLMVQEDRHSAALIQAILAMARGMDMEVVAEGIETSEQVKLLRLLGCHYGQGFGLGRPVDAEQALALAVPVDAGARRLHF